MELITIHSTISCKYQFHTQKTSLFNKKKTFGDDAGKTKLNELWFVDANAIINGPLAKDRSFLHLVEVNHEVNQVIDQSQARIAWLISWLTLTRCRKDRI